MLVRASADQRMSLSTIRALQVPLPNGQTVPLSQIASVDYGQEYPIVWRRPGQLELFRSGFARSAGLRSGKMGQNSPKIWNGLSLRRVFPAWGNRRGLRTGTALTVIELTGGTSGSFKATIFGASSRAVGASSGMAKKGTWRRGRMH